MTPRALIGICCLALCSTLAQAQTSQADLQRRVNERQKETEAMQRQVAAAKQTPGIPAGIYNCRNRTTNGYNVVLTIRIQDAGSYTVVGDKSERPGQYTFDAAKGKVSWTSGPLKANTVDNNRAADYEQEKIPPAMVLTVYRGLTATRCILST